MYMFTYVYYDMYACMYDKQIEGQDLQIVETIKYRMSFNQKKPNMTFLLDF